MPEPATVIETDIPARLDRLPWSRFHTLVVAALGITWILDGLEVTLAGSIAGALQESPVLHFDAEEVGLVGTAYLIGAVTGAVVFGYLTDRLGRRKLFFVTLGAAGAVVFLQPALPPDWGWRAAFGIGSVLGLGILMLRRLLPESPRWLVLHARPSEAEAVVEEIERRVANAAGAPLPPPAGGRIRLAVSSHTPMLRMVLAIVRDYPQRAVLGLVLMGSQAFFYNAIFFTYALVLTQFYGVPPASIGWYVLPFAIGNFFGPLLLGPLFDRLGRKPMIASTYAISGVLLGIVGYL